MAKRKSIDTNFKSNASSAAEALGLSIEEIKACRALDCPHAQGRYYLKEVKAWYDKNKDAVDEYLENKTKSNSGEWKQRKERAQALIAEIQLRTLEKNTLDKDKVIALLKTIGGSQAIVLRSMSQDMPQRLLGKGITEIQVELSKAYDAVCEIFSKGIETWTTQPNK